MLLDVPAVQSALVAAGLDGWLLYDFHGSNPIAARLAGLSNGARMTTRRWYYLIPATGRPRGLVHAIERHNLDHLPGDRLVYAGRQKLDEGLRSLIAGCARLAMEYSPGCAIPYVSRVDAGTVEQLRELGAEVVSSADLVQQFEARWDASALVSHRAAGERLIRVKDRAFAAIGVALSAGRRPTEYEVQQWMVAWFADEGLVSDSAPIVAAEEHAGDPHYVPSAEHSRTIDRDEVVLLDLWGKLDRPGAVFADITWMGFTGARPPEPVARAFDAVREARDGAIGLVERAVAAGRVLRGWEVDREARGVLERAGFGSAILHRTGHSLGESVHGNGANIDDYETHDDRRLIAGTGFTIEPGLYFDTFGVRTEINMYLGEGAAEVTGPAQSAMVVLA
jgi:Xaa-Pro aminopeptidase